MSDDSYQSHYRIVRTVLSDGDEVSIVWQDPNSNEEAVIGTFEYSG